jgi:hypothetical protein
MIFYKYIRYFICGVPRKKKNNNVIIVNDNDDNKTKEYEPLIPEIVPPCVYNYDGTKY